MNGTLRAVEFSGDRAVPDAVDRDTFCQSGQLAGSGMSEDADAITTDPAGRWQFELRASCPCVVRSNSPSLFMSETPNRDDAWQFIWQ